MFRQPNPVPEKRPACPHGWSRSGGRGCLDSGLHGAGFVSIEAASRGLFNLLAQNQQRGHCLEACAGRLVFSGVANPPDHLFAAKLLQVVGCWSRLVVRFAAIPNPGSQLGSRESSRPGGQGQDRLSHLAHACSVEIFPPTLVLPICAGAGSFSRVSWLIKHCLCNSGLS